MQPPRWLVPVEVVLELDGQPVQPVPPCWVMYVPVSQAVQAPLAGMPVPVWNVPDWQSWQALDELAPMEVEYVPGVHEVQAALAVSPVPVK